MKDAEGWVHHLRVATGNSVHSEKSIWEGFMFSRMQIS